MSERIVLSILALAILVLAVACTGACGDGEHSHPAHGAHEEHHAGHGPGAISLTRWGTRAELFAEYAPLVVGVPSETAIHITQVADFSALLAGSLTVSLKQADGSSITALAEAPARPGIFTPPVTPTVAGACQLTIAVRASAWSEAFTAPSCVVHADASAAETAEASVQDSPAASGISFLKEQQWNIDFATAVVNPRPMGRTVRVNAEIRPITGREAHLTAALAGRVQFSGSAPVLGMEVEKGQLLAVVTPPLTGVTNRTSLRAQVAAAEAELAEARDEQERVGKLAAQEAVATRRVRAAETQLSVAESRLRVAKERLREYDLTASGRPGSGNAFRVRSPIAGTLVAVEVTSGETVAGGAHLFTVIDMDRLWIEGRVFEPDIPLVVDTREAVFFIEGYERPFSINADTGHLVTVGQVLDPENRTVPIVFEVANPDNQLRIGQFAELEIAAGEPVPTLAVPASAVLIDGGRPVVFVHSEGETFERRFVRAGLKSAGWVQLVAGVTEGERVVSRGGHIIKLAGAASSAPAHGHAH